MGNALKFQSIFKEIMDDIKNQYYADIANQYGRMVRIIFLDFEKLQADGIEGLSRTQAISTILTTLNSQISQSDLPELNLSYLDGKSAEHF